MGNKGLITLVGVCGKVGSGKDTVADFIAQYSNYVWEKRKFAGKLKQIASLFTGVPVEKFEDQEFKKSILPKEWNRFISKDQPNEPMLVREFLQKLGTEAIRDGLHPNAWLNAMFSDFVLKAPNVVASTWVISDCRFPNEYQAIKDRGGLVIKVERPNNPYPVSNHPSETSLDGYEMDYTIVNDSTMYQLAEKVIAMKEELDIA